MEYSQVIKFLFEQLPVYQRTGSPAYKNSLNNTLELDKLLNHPHKKFKTVHVAGTNGKGSVSHLTASILKEAGYKTGLYTSPHLKDFRERIKVDGEMISKNTVVKFVETYQKEIEKIAPSFFEITVAMAFEYFAQKKVDIAVIETGLGGRLDSTNIIMPEVSIITNISLDHTSLLGNTITEIAKEKAGIIKPNTPVIVGRLQKETDQLFRQVSNKQKSQLCFAPKQYKGIIKNESETGFILDINKKSEPLYKNVLLPLGGSYQIENIITVTAAIEILNSKGVKTDEKSFYKGIKNIIENTQLQGRWQKIEKKPLIICDTAHNQESIKIVVEQLEKRKRGKLHIIFGMVNDKETDKIVSLLPKNAIYYFTNASIPRSIPAKELKEICARYNLKGEAYCDVKSAIAKAKKLSTHNDLIFIGGSTFIVADAI
ncbi:bifunctional folylpolyglutamate synthase/dihydrofolate synthase [Marinilabiliaceae bacterium ANBcel2]|nr:bifunctional folylpolyglutamate synthase/dihydrofolate synthase [Marinilabiliaceae bacterium ANBcel2]